MKRWVTRHRTKLYFCPSGKGQNGLHFEIAQMFQSMADAKAGRVRASVQTAQGLSEEEQTEIRTTLAQSIKTSGDKLVIMSSVSMKN